MTTLVSKSILDLSYRVSRVLITLHLGSYCLALLSVFIFPLSTGVRLAALAVILLIIVWNLRKLKSLSLLERVVLMEDHSYLVLAGKKVAIELTGEVRVLSSVVFVSCRAREESNTVYPKHIVFFKDSVNKGEFHLLRVFVKSGKFKAPLSP